MAAMQLVVGELHAHLRERIGMDFVGLDVVFGAKVQVPYLKIHQRCLKQITG